ncbi:hypothetical protein OMW55_06265 [Sphingomonas sp. BN140010]|uniref:Uncharacterized protein n=1 Tax=Sphingomonas arvum TaxID=2992113 RepID=A0ABT3JEC3_9SPHN|nr:hypothetical protein [Sphingomonas sp. BN140010]MCW3797408.1 hypothetical protein [Sphingomonas sp. BN140010]
MWRPIAILAALTVSTSSAAHAREDDLTTSSSVAPVFQDGQLQGCAFTFDVAHRDHEYAKGGVVKLAGSLNYYAWSGRSPLVSIKLGVHPFTEQGSKFEAPAEVYLILGNRTNRADKLQTIDAETGGFRMFAFSAGDLTMKSLVALAENGHLLLGYAMRAGGMLSLVEADARVRQINIDDLDKSEIDESAPKRWLDCLVEATNVGLSSSRRK